MKANATLKRFLPRSVLAAASLSLALASACSGTDLSREELASVEQGLCVEQLLAPASATASSIENASYGPQNAIDGNAGTRWSSAFSDPQWLSIDLAQARKISRVVLTWETAASAQYDLQVSSDGTNWTTIHSDNSGNGGVDDITGLNAAGRYLRVYSRARTTSWGVSLFSVAIYGDPNAACNDPVCGNGVVESGEQCDDGNITSGDGCGATCQTETAQCQSVALNRAGATSSSNESSTLGPDKAIDGNTQTRWSSAFANDQWLTVDLGASRRVRRVRLNWEAAYSANYEIQVSDSPTSGFTSVFSTQAGNGGIDDVTGLDKSGRYVRVWAKTRATPWGNSLWEVEVFGDQNPNCSDQSPTPLRRNVLWLVYDPIMASGQRLHQKYGWNDPFTLIPQINSTLRSASKGYADYQTLETRDLRVFPPERNRETFTEATYGECFDGTTNCSPTELDYGRIFADLGICSRIQSGEVDEVMIYGADWFGFDEFAFKIPGDRIPYNTPTNPWLYDLRRKNLPDCGRTYFVMGYNMTVGLDNAIHSFGHRVESALSLTVGRGYWDGCPGGPAGLTDWDKFTCIDINKTTSGASVAGCGNVHYPPNGQSDYDYGNPRTVTNACPSWQNYPFTSNTLVSQSCSTYGCEHLGYLQWWLGSLPLKNGTTTNGNLRNWWKYAIDFDSALRELGKL